MSDESTRDGDVRSLLASIVESSSDAIISKKLDGTILSWNAGAARLFGYSAEEAIGKKITLIIPPELVDEEVGILARLQRGERIEHFETVRVAKSGQRLDISLTISPVRDESGRIVAASKVARNITDQKKAVRAVQESQARLAAEAAGLMRLNHFTSRLWRARTLSQGVEEMLAAVTELLGAEMGNVQLFDSQRGVLHIAAQYGFGKEFLEGFREVSVDDDSACGRALRGGQRIVIEDVETDPSYFPFLPLARAAGYRSVQSTPLISGDGTPLGILSSHFRSPYRPPEQDLRRLDLYVIQAAEFIERCRRDEALRERDHRLQLALESGRMGAWDWSIASNKVTWSPTLEAIHGLEPGTFPGTFEAFQSDMHPEDRPAVLQTLAETLDRSRPHHVEYRIVRPDGTIRWVEGTGALMRNGSGSPSHMIGVCTDITERKQAEETLRESEERFARFMQHLPGLAWIKDRQGRYVFVNDAAERTFQLSRAQLYGRTDEEVFPKDTAGLFMENDRRVFLSEASIQTVETLEHPDGVHHSLVHKFPIPGAGGEIALVGGMAIDITERIRAEEALRRANADLEQFAYSASHDLQEPIRNIALSVEVLTDRYGTLLDTTGLEILSFVQESAARMGALVRDLLAYTQVASAEPLAAEVNASEALEKARSSLSAVIRETNAEVCSDPLPSVRIPEVQLQQVFQNLISNAIKYQREGERPRVHISAKRQGPEWVFSVQDNGIGISPQYHQRVFGIFKRLHGYGKYTGSGIGLAICQRIVERHGGRIWVESNGRDGSTFHFALPAAG